MRVLLSGGGTAGHINPALAVAHYLKDNHNAEILFVGTKKGMETTLVPKEGFPISYIEVEGLLRRLTIKNVKILYKYLRAIGKSKKIIKGFRPDLVIGTGGYVCAPVLSAAHKLKIPAVVHEQNVFPGVTVKLSANFVEKVAISFEVTIPYLAPSVREKCVLTGNPLRESMLGVSKSAAREKLGLDSRPFLVIYGGSLGAKTVNDALVSFLKSTDLSSFQLCAGTGKGYYDSVMEQLSGLELGPNIKIQPYIYDMETVMPAADLVVARSGALTVSELNALGKPSVLIPSPNVTHNHQEYNAKNLADAGAAVMLRESELTSDAFSDAVNTLLNSTQKLRQMSEASKKLGITDGTKRLAETALALLK